MNISLIIPTYNNLKQIKNINEWLTPNIKDKIYQIYKIDFKNFEYER